MKISDKYLFSHEKDIDSIKKAFEKKKLSGTSEIVEKYEKKLSSFFNSNYALAVSSGTAAIQVALSATEVSPGDEVIISSICPLMSVFPIISMNAIPIFCDTKTDNFGLEINDLKKKINSKTKAIIEVPMWGYPTDVERLSNFTKSKKIPLILDLAQAHGTKLNKNYLSSYGDISCFSTHDRKILSTGEGGYILTNNKKYYKKAASFIQFGNMNGNDFGLNYKLSALQAGIGINRTNHIKKQLKIRHRNARYIVNNIKNDLFEEFRIINRGIPNYYTLLLKLNHDKNFDVIKLLNKQGIPSDILRYNCKVLYKYPIFKKFKRICPNSEKLLKSITTIPVHPGLSKKELDYIVKKINSI